MKNYKNFDTHIFNKVDKVLLSLYFIFVAIGLVFMFGISRYAGNVLGLAPSLIFLKQLIFIIFSVLVMLFFARLDYRITRILVKPLVFLTLLILVLVFVPGVGLEAGGARRWINFRFFSFNPSELAKITMIIYLAHILVKKQNSLTNFTFGLLPPLLLAAIIFMITLLQSGFSIGAVIISVVFAMFFIGGASIKHIISIGFLSLPVMGLAVWKVAYRKDRIFAYLDPWRDPSGIGYQSIQSLQAIANGKLFGVGLGNGTQKISRLPAAHTDFIFSVIVEELGLVGGLAILGLFAYFFLQGLRLAFRVEDAYGRLLAFGIITLISTHALFNIMIAIAFLPPTGVSLPFISYGGSSFLVLSIAMGILLNISAHYPENKSEQNYKISY